MIEVNHPEISVRRQCQLIGLSRASFYMKPASETPLNLELMQLIDKQPLPEVGYFTIR